MMLSRFADTCKNASRGLHARSALGAAYALFASAMLGGCLSSQPPLLIPIEAAPDGGAAVDLLAITTRAPSSVLGEIYSGDRSRDISSQIISVSIPPNHQPGRLEWPSGEAIDPDKEFAVLDLQPAADEAAWNWLDHQEHDGRVLIFVHGYNVRFADAVYRLAQIANDMSVSSAPVLFSWPSNGALLGYHYDRESATYARDAFEQVISEAVNSEKVSEITLLAHSMGTWITMETLRQMSIRNGALPDKIVDVILAAPDLDIDVFEQQFVTLGDQRPHFTFLVSTDDRALSFSKALAGGVQRLGAIDPSQEPYRSRIEAMSGLTVVDLSDVKGGGNTRHTKFAESEEMLEFARRAIEDDEAFTTAQTSLGEHAGAIIVTLGLGVAELSD